jgi:hypothetical protein
MAIIAPSYGPLKTPCLQGKVRGVQGSAPFGDSDWTRLASSRRDKYCRNGGTAFAQPPRVGFTGSTMAIMAPSGGPLKTVGLQGKRQRVRGSVPFGGRNGLVFQTGLLRNPEGWPLQPPRRSAGRHELGLIADVP